MPDNLYNDHNNVIDPSTTSPAHSQPSSAQSFSIGSALNNQPAIYLPTDPNQLKEFFKNANKGYLYQITTFITEKPKYKNDKNEGKTIFHLAIENGANDTVIKAMLAEYKKIKQLSWVNQRDNLGRHPIELLKNTSSSDTQVMLILHSLEVESTTNNNEEKGQADTDSIYSSTYKKNIAILAPYFIENILIGEEQSNNSNTLYFSDVLDITLKKKNIIRDSINSYLSTKEQEIGEHDKHKLLIEMARIFSHNHPIINETVKTYAQTFYEKNITTLAPYFIELVLDNHNRAERDSAAGSDSKYDAEEATHQQPDLSATDTFLLQPSNDAPVENIFPQISKFLVQLLNKSNQEIIQDSINSYLSTKKESVMLYHMEPIFRCKHPAINQAIEQYAVSNSHVQNELKQVLMNIVGDARNEFIDNLNPFGFTLSKVVTEAAERSCFLPAKRAFHSQGRAKQADVLIEKMRSADTLDAALGSLADFLTDDKGHYYQKSMKSIVIAKIDAYLNNKEPDSLLLQKLLLDMTDPAEPNRNISTVEARKDIANQVATKLRICVKP